jgi:aspartate ammonia-lyase
MYRVEKDILGEMKLPADALYGIHAARARENFPGDIRFPLEWYMATGLTKQACYHTYRKYRSALARKSVSIPAMKMIEDSILDNLIAAAEEVAAGKHFDSFIVQAVQGGAGTSINMNINEIITNVALLKSGHKCGDYSVIDPLEHANIFQSTNDVIPTALTVAAMKLFDSLGEQINKLRQKTEQLEKKYRDRLRPGYTQMQEAVPTSFGVLFSTYNEALSRDWWRVSKCSERIKQVNLGGGAVGTGLALPRFYIMEVVPELRNITGLPLAHSENLPDATSNLDRWVEIHATLKAHAVNMEKISADLRLLASDISGSRPVRLPERQAGSSIMPGKINPVIPEFVISSVHRTYANDVLISSLCAQGTLELNAYLPVIGHAVIESLNLLINCNKTMLTSMLEGIIVDEEAGYAALIKSPSVTTALTPHTGYHNASEIARLMKEKHINVFEANSILRVLDETKLRSLLEPGNLLKLGFSIDDLT